MLMWHRVAVVEAATWLVVLDAWSSMPMHVINLCSADEFHQAGLNQPILGAPVLVPAQACPAVQSSTQQHMVLSRNCHSEKGFCFSTKLYLHLPHPAGPISCAALAWQCHEDTDSEHRVCHCEMTGFFGRSTWLVIGLPHSI